MIIFLPLFTLGQTKKITDELKRASKYDERKRMDTYHVLEKYLTNAQRYELNMFYWNESVNVPKENAKNYWLLNSALDGNICAQINLSYSYKTGRIVKKDSNNCRNWLLKAINNRSNKALYYYGLNCLDNTFKKIVSDSATYYFLQADIKGITEASLAIAYCYKYGLKIIQNDSAAYSYYTKYVKKDYYSNYSFSLDSSIFCPNGFCSKDLIKQQLNKYLEKLRSDTQLVLYIKTNGNSSYETQQLSWNKANIIRTFIIDNGINADRICLFYGGNGNNSIVEILVTNRDEQFINILPPPPVPNFGKNIVLECD